MLSIPQGNWNDDKNIFDGFVDIESIGIYSWKSK